MPGPVRPRASSNCWRFKRAILGGQLPPGSRLPSTAACASSCRWHAIRCWRSTSNWWPKATPRPTARARVGYAAGRARHRPRHSLRARNGSQRQSRRVSTMKPTRDAGDRSLPLTPGMPALNRFP
jgi:GntR family transcriptional regulator/MocR family aminotransferase